MTENVRSEFDKRNAVFSVGCLSELSARYRSSRGGSGKFERFSMVDLGYGELNNCILGLWDDIAEESQVEWSWYLWTVWANCDKCEFGKRRLSPPSVQRLGNAPGESEYLELGKILSRWSYVPKLGLSKKSLLTDLYQCGKTLAKAIRVSKSESGDWHLNVEKDELERLPSIFLSASQVLDKLTEQGVGNDDITRFISSIGTWSAADQAPDDALVTYAICMLIRRDLLRNLPVTIEAEQAERPKPVWDKKELVFNGNSKQLSDRAKNQRLVLDAFQAKEWQDEEVKTPFKTSNNLQKNCTLRDMNSWAISLGLKFSSPRLSFIRWERISPEAPPS